MSLETLDSKAALVVIDLQRGIVDRDTEPYSTADVVSRSAKLAKAFRSKGLPVVLVNVTGGAPGRNDAAKSAPARPAPAANWAELVPELDTREGDILVTKQRWGAFHGTDLDARLRELDVTQIVLTGVATSIGVESTARFAYEYGYNIALVTDAMTDMSAEAHENSVERIFPRLGESADTDEVLAILADS